MASDITLSSTQRQTLLSLQQTSRLSDRTQVRLATGREINGVTDGAEDFFAARTLQRRSGILSERNEQVDQGISTIQAALEGIDALDEFLSQLRGLVRQARSQTAEERAATTNSFDEVVAQFQNLLEDTSYQGLNLLNNENASLTVRFSEETTSQLNIDGVDILNDDVSNGGVFEGRDFLDPRADILSVNRVIGQVSTAAIPAVASVFAVAFQAGGVRAITDGFGTVGAATERGLSAGFSVLSNANNLNSLNELDARLSAAQDNLESRANVLANNVAILQTRLEYGENLISNHVQGADKIVNADLNEEAANLTATGTQYQIGVQSLGVAGQRVQSLLQLIR